MATLLSHLKHHFYFYLTLIIGFMVSIITYLLTNNRDLTNFFTDPLPQSFYLLFLHNLSFFIIFSIPVLGHLYYLYVFIIIFISIGLSFSYRGILYTLLNLYHMPFEIMAFSIILKNSTKKLKERPFLLATCLLLFSALLEFYLSGR